MTTWRNGTICTSSKFGTCGYRTPCVLDAREADGQLLVQRDVRHSEIAEATAIAPYLDQPERLDP
jgi:hypothetical protein